MNRNGDWECIMSNEDSEGNDIFYLMNKWNGDIIKRVIKDE